MTIITKIDGRDANFLNNFKLVDRGLGAICVRNRTQAEITAGLSFNDVLDRERNVLSEEDFAAIPTDQKGILALVEALVSHQREMIIQFKPVLRQQLACHR